MKIDDKTRINQELADLFDSKERTKIAIYFAICGFLIGVGIATTIAYLVQCKCGWQ